MEERTDDHEHLPGGRGVSGELRRRHRHRGAENRKSTPAALSRHTTDGEASDVTQESVEGWRVGSPAGLALLDGCEDSEEEGGTVNSCGTSPRKSDGSPPHACMVSPSPPNSPEAASCIVLLSKGVCDYRQRANQNATIDTLNDFGVPHTLVDGMDQTQVAAREALFCISGIRGSYPQLFLKSSVSGDSVYLGGHEWLTSEANLQDLKRRCCVGGENKEDEDLYGRQSRTATPGSSSLARPRFAILVSTGVFDLEQRANQAAALRLLRGVDIDYEIVDGMDPAQKDRRDAFFAISGLRGCYPQVFFDQTHYLGGFEYLRGLQRELAQRQQGE
ncbi:hypothetical protein THAOC_06381 [Thalassiosira oceanica]|uniref:Glutaredoxin domain-containing protein n=1 Tax=Thalassiosira oceanica TaxID=159749 RepID=K0T4R1_THAOC|nr:hypothetical protein THAOC_06381 [Thalassiosira oceanica]|eukprot:EJK72119.1 hypothetical protein THAOC_06381 [Thalassiosira oceanica]